MLSFSLLVVAVLIGVLWLTYREEILGRYRPFLKVEKIWAGEERRNGKRIPTSVSVLYTFPRSSKTNTSNSRDISGGGIQLILSEKLSPGEGLELEFALTEGEKPFRIVAQVVWVSETEPAEGKRLFRTGLKFARIETKEAVRLEASLYRKEGEGRS